MLQWFIFLYGDEVDVQFDAMHALKMLGGMIQGLTSSNLYYSAMKWDVQQTAFQQMEAISPDFVIDFQMDYVDDGLQLIMDKYIPQYVKILISIYDEWGIHTHPGKSKVILNTDDDRRTQWMQDTIPNFDHKTNGCFTFLGVPHGDEEYVINYIRKHLTKIYKKIQYIQRIQHMQIRINLHRKLFNYNKIIYLIKHCKYIDKWMPDMVKMYNVITSSITSTIQDRHKATVKWQMSLSQRAGG